MLDELLAAEGVREEVELAGAIGVMALHGGLEAGTAELAGEIGRTTGASRYVVIQPDELAWHVPSVRYDPRVSSGLRRFLEHVQLAISLHGFGRQGLEDAVLLGGSNRRVADLLAAALGRHTPLRTITDLDAMPAGLRGLHLANPVNLPEHGGVQVELSPGARAPQHLPGLLTAVASVVRSEMGSICASA